MKKISCVKGSTLGADLHIMYYTKSAIEFFTDAQMGNAGKPELGKIHFSSIA